MLQLAKGTDMTYALELSNILSDIYGNKTACNKRHFCWDFLTNQEVY